LFAFYAGKLLEARGFADQIELEDAFFGAALAPDTAARHSSPLRQRQRR